MQPSELSTALFLMMCGGLCFTGFCRLVHISQQTTDPFISTAFWVLTVVAVFGIFSVVFWGYEAGWPGVAISGAMLTIQIATSRAWKSGLPEHFKRVIHHER